MKVKAHVINSTAPQPPETTHRHTPNSSRHRPGVTGAIENPVADAPQVVFGRKACILLYDIVEPTPWTLEPLTEREMIVLRHLPTMWKAC